MKSLYAYYGLLDLHNIDSPGHSLYQIGLVDSLRESYGETKFDFYSYYPEEIIKSANLGVFPSTELGKLFYKYRTSLFDQPIHNIDELLIKIKAKEYNKLFLKARFRNLSSLSKKWKDAREFEDIITTAFNAGYSKDEIIILDTDLSLSERFLSNYGAMITVIIPSIDIPGVSNTFLKECVDLHTSQRKLGMGSVFYGNIDTSKYKSGNSKSTILPDVLSWVNSFHNIKGTHDPFYLICKENDFKDFSNVKENTHHIERNNRPKIWETLENSRIMLNITKDKYDNTKFIPARIFEAMVFGMIPISYKFDFLCKAFSFNNVTELIEIYLYLSDCTEDDLKQAYLHFVNGYLSHINQS